MSTKSSFCFSKKVFEAFTLDRHLGYFFSLHLNGFLDTLDKISFSTKRFLLFPNSLKKSLKLFQFIQGKGVG